MVVRRGHRIEFASILIVYLAVAGCTACNVMLPSRSMEIPIYRIGYYHSDDLARVTQQKETPDVWYKQKWENGFQIHFKIARVEETGIYFYRLRFHAINPLEEQITLYDQNIELTDMDSGVPIEQIKCWNWQKIGSPCNVATVRPKGELYKEIRYGYSIDDKYAPGVQLHLSGLNFDDSEVRVDLHSHVE